MRSKFSPRQKVVSFALAILTLGVLVILGYRLLGNIFASDQTSGQKQKVTVAINNWDIQGQPLFHKYFDIDKKAVFSCSVIELYMADPDNKKIEIAIEDVIYANQDGANKLSFGKDNLTNTIESLPSRNKFDTNVGKLMGYQEIQNIVIPNSSFPGDKLKTTCDRGSTGSESTDYKRKIIIPDQYKQDSGANSQITKTPAKSTTPNNQITSNTDTLVCARVIPDGTNDSEPTKYEWIEESVLGPGGVDTAYYAREKDTSKCGPRPTTGSSSTLVCARVIPDGTNDSEPTKYEWIEESVLGPGGVDTAYYAREKDTSKCGPRPTTGSSSTLVCARVVPDGTNDTAPTKYEWVEESLIGADYVKESDTSKCGPRPTVGTSGTGNDSFVKEVKVSISVKTQEGLAVKTARVEIERLDNLGRILSGTAPDYVTTDENGNAQTTIRIAGTDSKDIKQIQATAQKLSQTQSKQVAWSNQSDIAFQFVLNLSSTEAGTDQNWTATGGEEPYIAPIIDYDASWPGGPNSIDLIAVRRSMHNANYNGYTPVGGVEFYINVFTNTPPATARRSENTLMTLKAQAQSNDVTTDGEGAQIPQPTNNEYGFKETNNNYRTSAGNTPIGAPLPYDLNEVIPYNSTLLRALREKNQTKYSYSSRGRIADNGLNSGITINNLPSGIYDIELRKSNFYSSRFIMFVNNTSGSKKVSLPIAPRTYAEPPSIDSGKIDKQPNKDVYSANGFVYVSKYPWFGWQKENEYIFQKPFVANGVPTTMGENGQPIGGIYGSPEMQACIGKKMQSVGVGVSGLTMKDVLLGAGGAYLLKQSGKQNDDWVKGGMIAGGIYSLIELAKSSEAKVNINYDQFDCAELLYGGRNTIPIGCEACFMNVDGAMQGRAGSNCDPRCMLQYSPLMNITSLLPFGNLFGNK